MPHVPSLCRLLLLNHASIIAHRVAGACTESAELCMAGMKKYRRDMSLACMERNAQARKENVASLHVVLCPMRIERLGGIIDLVEDL